VDLDTALGFARPRHQGVLVTVRRDGRPQLSNIVYRVGGDDLIRISVTADRAKTKNLARDGRASLYVGRDDFWAYVVIDGTAELTSVAARPDDATVDELVDLYRSLQGEHSNWDEYRATMVADKRLVARIRPERAYGMVPPH
jgi:PPOX class probable F420-dependent enzyme